LKRNLSSQLLLNPLRDLDDTWYMYKETSHSVDTRCAYYKGTPVQLFFKELPSDNIFHVTPFKEVD
jgi:hypothetical protein